MTILPPNEPANIESLKPADGLKVWSEFREKAIKLKTTAETLTVTDVSQVSEMKLARATRLSIRDLRLGFTATHKELKAEALETCQMLDKEKRELLALCEPLEARLLEQEQ